MIPKVETGFRIGFMRNWNASHDPEKWKRFLDKVMANERQSDAAASLPRRVDLRSVKS
jgi:uncharacterized protein YhdP